MQQTTSDFTPIDLLAVLRVAYNVDEPISTWALPLIEVTETEEQTVTEVAA